MLAMNQLKPCPFCGGRPDWAQGTDHMEWFLLECTNCGATPHRPNLDASYGSFGYLAFPDEDDAIQAWERRDDGRV